MLRRLQSTRRAETPRRRNSETVKGPRFSRMNSRSGGFLWRGLTEVLCPPPPQCPSMREGRQVLPPQLKVRKKGFRGCFLCTFKCLGKQEAWSERAGLRWANVALFQRAEKQKHVVPWARCGSRGKADKGTPQRWVMKTQRLEGCCSALPRTHTPLPHGETSG